MRTRTLKGLIATAIFITCTPASSGFFSSTKLMQLLEEDMRGASSFDAAAGTGYVIGVFDVVDGILACSPDDVTVKQVKQVVFNYMKAHPEKWSNSADSSVVAALQSAWPCRKK